LRATIEWSYELLTPQEQQLLAALSIFRGGWTLAAAERVCAADVELLESLVDKSLIRRWEGERFGMLATIREFAAEQLAEQERAALLKRLTRQLLELAEAANMYDEAEGAQRPELLHHERGNDRCRARVGARRRRDRSRPAARLLARALLLRRRSPGWLPLGRGVPGAGR
jgi:predicted ATPase